MVEPDHCRINLQRQCELLGLNRSSWYLCTTGGQKPLESDENLALMRAVDEEFTAHPFFGSRQMRNILRRKGWIINRKRMQRLMRKMGLVSVAPKPGLSKPAPGHRIYPYLLRNLPIVRPNQVWSTDITYIPLNGSFCYLTVILDWFSRYVLAWELSETMETNFCTRALKSALTRATPEIHNSDQGSQYTS